MAIKFDKIQVGMTLKQIKTVGVGNTTRRRKSVYDVVIKEIDALNKRALVSWNGNRAEWWRASRVEMLFRADSPTVKKVDAAEREFDRSF